MKRNIFVTIVVLLLVTGGVSYLIIWWRNKKNADAGSLVDSGSVSQSTSNSQSGSVLNTGTKQQASIIPNSYAWWKNKLGHATFPLGNGSKGVEVVKVQEVMNTITASKPVLGLSAIAVDGIWGPLTNARFKTLYPGYNSVTLGMFINEFDKNGEILN